MANPAADARAKVQANSPGASVSARGRKAITHQHPSHPNKFASDYHIGPIHYGAAGATVPAVHGHRAAGMTRACILKMIDVYRQMKRII